MPIVMNVPKSVGLPYERPIEEVLAGLETNTNVGLTSREARERQSCYGLNVLQLRSQISCWQRFLAQFRDPQVALLVAAAAVSIVVSIVEKSSPIFYEPSAILTIWS